MLTHLFNDERYEGTPYKSEHVDYFRDTQGRCVALVNARIETPKLVDGPPMPTFDRVEVDGALVTGPELDALVPKIMRVLLGTLRWEQTEPGGAVVLRAPSPQLVPPTPRKRPSRPIPPHTPGPTR